MSETDIPEKILQSAKNLLASESTFFNNYLSVVFKPMTVLGGDIGCYSDITLPNDKSIAINSFPFSQDVVYHMVIVPIKDGKKRLPYIMDLNRINSSIKIKYRKLYKNNMTFTYLNNVLNTVAINQSITPNGSDEINYLVYSKDTHAEFGLNDRNSMSFYIFNFLMQNTRLAQILPDSTFLNKFEQFMAADKSYCDLLQMYEV